jgi:hypothetical protein
VGVNDEIERLYSGGLLRRGLLKDFVIVPAVKKPICIDAGPKNVEINISTSLINKTSHLLRCVKNPFVSNENEKNDANYVMICNLKKKISNLADSVLEIFDISWGDNPADQIVEIREKARQKREGVVKAQMAKRTMTFLERLQKNWKRDGAKALFRFLRNSSKVPRSTFADPANRGKYTADPLRIAELFTTDWQKMYCKPAEYGRPCWMEFAASFENIITEIPGLSRSFAAWRLHGKG